MTMPHQHNCPHQDDGWCLYCVGKLQSKNESIVALISECDQAIHHLNCAGGGKEYQEGWTVPKHLTVAQIKDNCVQAYHRIMKIRMVLAEIDWKSKRL